MKNATLFLILCCMLLSFRLSAIIEITYVKNCSSTSASDGQMEAVANGNAGPFNFQWSNGIQTNNATSSKITNLTPGTYSVTVSTQNGCTFVLSASVGICGYGYPGFEIQTVTVLDVTLPNANDGKIDINIINNTAYKNYVYKWTDANGLVVATTQDLVNIPGGTYTVLVTNGCYEQSKTFTVKDCNTFSPIRLSLNSITERCTRPGYNDNRIDLTAVSDFKPLQYQWTGPNGYTSTQQNLTNLPFGNYCVTVTDRCGRTATDCMELKCCDPKKLPNVFSDYNCYYWRAEIFGWIKQDHDGHFEVKLPNTPFDQNCAKSYTLSWTDGTTNTVTFNDNTGNWEGISHKAVPPSYGDVLYCVTITDQCGCSATRCDYFGPNQDPYSGFWTHNVNDFFTRFDNRIRGFEFFDKNLHAITRCVTCEGGCGMRGATNVINGDCENDFEFDYLSYTDNDPTDEKPCRGGSINCRNNPPDPTKPWEIQDQIEGTEIVNYEKVETRILDGQTYCVNPTWCLFAPGTIDYFPGVNLPVLVEHPFGKIIEGAQPPCNYEDEITPPYSECPGGIIGPDPNGVTENCVLYYKCLSTGHIVNQIQENVIVCRCSTLTGCYMAYKCEMFQGNTGQSCNAFYIDYDSNCVGSGAEACVDYARPAERTESSGSRSNNKDPFSIQVYPNPNSGQVQISINPGTLLKDNHVSISLSDVAGRNLLDKEVQIFSDNPVYTLSMVENNIAPGAYYLTIKVANRPNMSFLILVVQ